MKYTLSVFILFMQMAAFGKTYTVDNTRFAGADFSNIQTAINAASSGDTLIVMPSYDNYGNLTINKKLFIYGRGVHGFKITTDKVTYVNNVEFVQGADGSVIQGFHLTATYGVYMRLSNCSRISIINNFFNGSNLIFATNYASFVDQVIVKGNIFWASSNAKGSAIEVNDVYYSDFSNNYFIDYYNGYYDANYQFLYGGNATNTVRNNLFVFSEKTGVYYRNDRVPVFFRGSNMVIHNNILWTDSRHVSRFDSTSTGADYRKNITYSRNTQAQNLSGNNYNDTLPEFETDFSSNPINYDLSYNFRLKNGTIGKNGGTDSTDVGLYGNGFIFDLHTKTSGVPIFEDFQIINPVVKRGGTLKVNVAARKPEH